MLNECAGRIVGTHDFSTFSAIGDQSRSKVRIVRAASFYIEGDCIVFRIVGNAFLWKMVRSLVGTILECCRERHPAKKFEETLRSRDRKNAGTTAPAKGLVLNRVEYDE